MSASPFYPPRKKLLHFVNAYCILANLLVTAEGNLEVAPGALLYSAFLESMTNEVEQDQLYHEPSWQKSLAEFANRASPLVNETAGGAMPFPRLLWSYRGCQSKMVAEGRHPGCRSTPHSPLISSP